MKEKVLYKPAPTRKTDWRKSNIGWRGFFEGYSTAELDAIARARARVGYIIANLKFKIKEKKSDAELLEFLERICVLHGE